MAAAENVDQQQPERQPNLRDFDESFPNHQDLEDLRRRDRDRNEETIELFKTKIGQYPQPEFHVSDLKYDTDSEGLRGIKENEGFRAPLGSVLVRWELKVGGREISAAEEEELLTTTKRERPLNMEQRGDLEKFATSPAFHFSTLKPFRFTFPLQKVLEAYREQFCDGKEPQMRAFRTYLSDREVMYVVLVHRPSEEELFIDYPELTNEANPVCGYKDGRIIWKAQAMCGTHRFSVRKKGDHLKVNQEENPLDYLWDHVSVALHVGDQVLKFNDDDLSEGLTFSRDSDEPQALETAVSELWPNCPALRTSPEVEGATTQIGNMNLSA